MNLATQKASVLKGNAVTKKTKATLIQPTPKNAPLARPWTGDRVVIS